MEAFWAIFSSLLGAAIGAWATYRVANPKRQFRFTVLKNDSLLNTDSEDVELSVRRGSDDLRKPRIVDLSFEYRGKKPITAESFHAGSSITVELGAQVKHVISSSLEPDTAISPDFQAVGEELRIPPSLWTSGQRAELSLLVDGDAEEIGIISPLTEAVTKQVFPETEASAAASQRRRTRIMFLGITILVGFLIGVIVAAIATLHNEKEAHKTTKQRLDDACEILYKEKVITYQNERDIVCGTVEGYVP